MKKTRNVERSVQRVSSEVSRSMPALLEAAVVLVVVDMVFGYNSAGAEFCRGFVSCKG